MQYITCSITWYNSSDKMSSSANDINKLSLVGMQLPRGVGTGGAGRPTAKAPQALFPVAKGTWPQEKGHFWKGTLPQEMLFRLDFCLNGLWFKIAFIFPSPRRQRFRENFFRCLFHSKSFEGPQLFDASYAPATTWKISPYICQVVASLPTKACYLSCILVVTKLVKKK